MEKIWILLLALLIFLVFAFLVWKLTSGDIKKEYGTRMWNQWPSRLYYWQGVVLYGVGWRYTKYHTFMKSELTYEDCNLIT